MRTTRQQRYDTGQHQLVCTDLGVSNNPDAPGPTAHEAVQNLKEQHQETVRLLEKLVISCTPTRFPTDGKIYGVAMPERAVVDATRAHVAKLKGTP